MKPLPRDVYNPPHEHIAVAAYYRWRALSQPRGMDVAIWMAAKFWLIYDHENKFLR